MKLQLFFLFSLLSLELTTGRVFSRELSMKADLTPDLGDGFYCGVIGITGNFLSKVAQGVVNGVIGFGEAHPFKVGELPTFYDVIKFKSPVTTFKGCLATVSGEIEIYNAENLDEKVIHGTFTVQGGVDVDKIINRHTLCFLKTDKNEVKIDFKSADLDLDETAELKVNDYVNTILQAFFHDEVCGV